MLKRLIGLMVLVFASVGAHAASIPAVFSTCSALTVPALHTCALAWFQKYFDNTPPGFATGTYVTVAGYQSAVVTTYLVMSSTAQPISNTFYASVNYLGIVTAVVAMYPENGVEEFALDNAFYSRSVQDMVRSKCCSGTTLSNMNPTSLEAWASLSYSTTSVINGGYPTYLDGVGLGIPKMLGVNGTDLNTGLPFTIFEGQSFIAVDKNNWTVKVTYSNGKFTADPNSVTDASGHKCPLVNGKFTSPGSPPPPVVPNAPSIVPGFVPGAPGNILWPLPTTPPSGSGCIDDGSNGPQSCNKSGVRPVPVLPL